MQHIIDALLIFNWMLFYDNWKLTHFSIFKSNALAFLLVDNSVLCHYYFWYTNIDL